MIKENCCFKRGENLDHWEKADVVSSKKGKVAMRRWGGGAQKRRSAKGIGGTFIQKHKGALMGRGSLEDRSLLTSRAKRALWGRPRRAGACPKH